MKNKFNFKILNNFLYYEEAHANYKMLMIEFGPLDEIYFSDDDDAIVVSWETLEDYLINILEVTLEERKDIIFRLVTKDDTEMVSNVLHTRRIAVSDDDYAYFNLLTTVERR